MNVKTVEELPSGVTVIEGKIINSRKTDTMGFLRRTETSFLIEGVSATGESVRCTLTMNVPLENAEFVNIVFLNKEFLEQQLAQQENERKEKEAKKKSNARTRVSK
jgi:hypothetical protein